MIIIEGYDGAGKSELAKFLSMSYNQEIKHAGPPAKDDRYAIECCKNQLKHISQNRILDRVTPISRLCYQLHLSLEHKMLLQMYLVRMASEAVVIWCKPNNYKHVEKAHDSKEHLLDIDRRASSIQFNYDQLMPSVADIVFNFDTMSYREVINQIEDLL